jgi:hypothetical protein
MPPEKGAYRISLEYAEEGITGYQSFLAVLQNRLLKLYSSRNRLLFINYAQLHTVNSSGNTVSFEKLDETTKDDVFKHLGGKLINISANCLTAKEYEAAKNKLAMKSVAAAPKKAPPPPSTAAKAPDTNIKH